MTELDTSKMAYDEMIDTLRGLVFGTFDRTTAKEREALDMAIKALEQEPFMNKPCVAHQVCHEDKVKVLDKIKAEIEALPKTYPFVNHIDMYVKEDDVKKIINKYRAESEDKK